MYKRITGMLVVTASLLVAPFFASPAIAEAIDAPPPIREVDDDEDEDFDLGWLGLIGLVGLAGLMRRDRDRHHVDRPVGTTVGTTGTTTRTH